MSLDRDIKKHKPKMCFYLKGIVFGCLILELGTGCTKKNEGISESDSSEAASDPDTNGLDNKLSKESRVGPVSATVLVSPKEPKLGDKLELVLNVEAEAGVSITMPDYDPALGRFDVLKHSASNNVTSEAKQQFQERYSMQATRSGRMRIPRLRIEFEDKRQNQVDDVEGDEGPKELLTEEIALVVADVLPEDARGQALPETPGTLDPAFGQTFFKRFGWLLLPLIIAFGLIVLFFRWRKKSNKQEAKIDPYDAAVARIEKLKSQGVPDEEGLDDWYVELSSIVRHYVEGRFNVRAPELTTEEFLRVAQQSKTSGLSLEHKNLLGELLEGCDRVKFGKYRPANEEIQSALEITSKFIKDTQRTAVDRKTESHVAKEVAA